MLAQNKNLTDLILVPAHWILGFVFGVWGERLEITSGKGEHSNIPVLSPHIQQWHLPIPLLHLNLNQARAVCRRAPPLLVVFVKNREQLISI